MTLAIVLYHIRKELLEFRISSNKAIIIKLSAAIGVIVDALEETSSYSNLEAVKIITHLYDAIRDSQMGTEWKSYIPSEEEIKSAFLN